MKGADFPTLHGEASAGRRAERVSRGSQTTGLLTTGTTEHCRGAKSPDELCFTSFSKTPIEPAPFVPTLWVPSLLMHVVSKLSR